MPKLNPRVLEWISPTLRMATLFALAFLPVCLPAQAFEGHESTTLVRVNAEPGQWGLKIVVFDVGQADAILLLTPNGDVAVIDTGRRNSDGEKIATYLTDASKNGVGKLTDIGLLYSTHYDSDHIGGLPKLVGQGIRIEKAYDQGPSAMRSLRTDKGNPTVYSKYVTALGDPDGDSLRDPDEANFVRHTIEYGDMETLGLRRDVKILCVAVRGDTRGKRHDLDLDLSIEGRSINKNAGSIALLVRLGEFEFYTAGDQTSGEWKGEPATEEAVIRSGAIPDGNDIDVLKVGHHGSDTSTGNRLAAEMLPEVAIVSTKYGRYGFPKRIVLKQLQDNRSYVLITGDGLDGHSNYTDAETNEDDAFAASPDAVFNEQGDVTVLVSPDGDRYTVYGKAFAKTFSARDTDNKR